jgi:uncharacterized membrane protein YhaH (DUF805 family)
MLEAWFFWNGRMGRLAYFGYTILLSFILGMVGFLLLLPTRNSPNGPTVAIVVIGLLSLVGAYCGVCLAVKRLHDLDLSGWHYAWMALLPGALNGLAFGLHEILLWVLGAVFSLAVGFILLLWPGTDGTNRFGYKPA